MSLGNLSRSQHSDETNEGSFIFYSNTELAEGPARFYGVRLIHTNKKEIIIHHKINK